MYLLAMDQLTREDITAAAAAHQELGPHYDGAVAEGLVERIGEEIDKRVDARLSGRGRRTARRLASRELSPVLSSLAPVVLALGSMGIGIGATGAVLSMSTHYYADGASTNVISSGQLGLAVLIWVVIGIINVSYHRRH
jgi:hypothetical protein